MELHESLQHLPPAAASWIAETSAAIGIQDDQLRLVMCLFAAIPLGLVHKRLPNPFIKHLNAFLTGFLFVWFLIGWSSLHLLFSGAVVYGLSAALPPSKAPKFVVCFAMAYLSVGHIYRMITDYLGWRMDYSTLQMVLTVKLVTFAYNYADGQLLKEGKVLHCRDFIPLATYAVSAPIGEPSCRAGSPSTRSRKASDSARVLRLPFLLSHHSGWTLH